MIPTKETVKVCPATVFIAPVPMPEWTGETYEDLVLYVKALRAHIRLLNEDRAAVSEYCTENQ